MQDPAKIVEQRDLILYLSQQNPDLVLQLMDPENFTAKGKVKVATIARNLGCYPMTVVSRLAKLREFINHP